jgi:ATP-dependent Clp protease ATP-binding subunit ClpA
LLLGAGSASGSMDAANILKPALARGAIRVIGATTTREYRQTIEKDGARVGRDRRPRPHVRPHGRCD